MSNHDNGLLLASAKFWLKPILLGGCLALGYGITHRVMTIQINIRGSSAGQFDKKDFPGERLLDITVVEEDAVLTLMLLENRKATKIELASTPLDS